MYLNLPNTASTGLFFAEFRGFSYLVLHLFHVPSMYVYVLIRFEISISGYRSRLKLVINRVLYCVCLKAYLSSFLGSFDISSNIDRASLILSAINTISWAKQGAHTFDFNSHFILISLLSNLIILRRS